MNSYFKPSPQQIIAWVNKNFDVKPRKNGTELRINSPFSDDSGYNFNISPEKGTAHSWHGDEWAGPRNPKTGKRGCSFVKFVQLYRKCSYRLAVAEIQAAAPGGAFFLPTRQDAERDAAQHHGGGPLSPGQKDGAERQVRLPDGSVRLVESKAKIASGVILRRLASRGVTPEMAKFYDIHHVGTDIVWPYYEFGDLVYWQSRSTINKIFKFPSVEESGANKTDFLYNFDNVEPASYVVIVEAIFGAMTLGDQCVATGGADLSDLQVRKLSLLGPKDGVVLAPDNDHAGITSLLRNAKKLVSKGFKVYYSLPPRVKYVEGDETRYTKDWNEFYEKCHYSLESIRSTFESGHAEYGTSAVFSLSKRLEELKPTRRPNHH